MDGVVANPEGPGVDEPADADEQAADHGPPHPVQVSGQLLEQILEAVDRLGHDPGAQTGGDPDRGGAEEDHPAERGVVGDGEDGLGGDQPGVGHGHAQPVRGGGGQADQDHGAGPEFEGQQFDAEQGGGHRSPEHRAHPGRGAGYQQGPPFCGGEPEQLTDDGAHRPAGQDDGPLGPERPAGADTDGAGDGFEHSQAGLDPAAVDQDPFHGLGDAVAADLLGAEAGHQPHHQPAPDGDYDGQHAEGVGRR